MAEKFAPNWGKLIPYLVIHVAAVAGVALVGVSVEAALWCGVLYAVRVTGATVGYHRYFSHRSFKTSRPMHVLIGLWANLSMMRGPLTWASHHRYHHKHADGERDLHSPKQRGFWFSHTGWFLSREYDETKLIEVNDLEKYPELRWLDRYYWVAGNALSLALLVFGGWQLFVWGGLVSTVLAWHAIFFINSVAHTRFGWRRFDTDDTSHNSFLLALLLFGEGWHNNHHHHMHSARNGFRWWEVDVSYYLIWVMAKVRLVWDVRPAPGHDPATAHNETGA